MRLQQQQQPRFESTRHPFNLDCFGKVIVRNISMRFMTDESLRVWLNKYGKIEETKVLETAAIVRFTSDAEASVAVQRENGSRRFGNPVTVEHAEPNLLWQLERSGLIGGTVATEEQQSSYRIASSAAGEQDVLRAGLKRAVSSAASKSPPQPLRNVKSAKKLETTSNDFGPLAMKILRPYEVAILAITHDLVPYAEAVQTRLASLVDASIADYYSPRSHIMVLTDVEHLTPCIQDLTADGVLFAIIVDSANWARYSCTLRILHSAAQQEHRNIPLVEAISFLSNDYSNHLTTKISVPTPEPILPVPPVPQPVNDLPEPVVVVRNRPREDEFNDYAVPPPATATAATDVEDEDSVFLKPSRHISTLLRMLADSRVLSMGELDQLIAFILERRNLLNQQYTSSTPCSGNVNWKSQVLDLLTPPVAVAPALAPNYHVTPRNPDYTRQEPTPLPQNAIQSEITHSGFNNGQPELQSVKMASWSEVNNQLSTSAKTSDAAKVFYQHPGSGRRDGERQRDSDSGRDSSRHRRSQESSYRSRREGRFDDRRASPSSPSRSSRRSGRSGGGGGGDESSFSKPPSRFVLPSTIATCVAGAVTTDSRPPAVAVSKETEAEPQQQQQQQKKDWTRLYGKDFEDY